MKSVRLLIMTISFLTLLTSVYASSSTYYVTIGRVSLGEDPKLGFAGNIGIQYWSSDISIDILIYRADLGTQYHYDRSVEHNKYVVSSILPGLFLNVFGESTPSIEFGPVVRCGLANIKRTFFKTMDGSDGGTVQTVIAPFLHFGLRGIFYVQNISVSLLKEIMVCL
jgi:hypothetical protein